MGFGTQVVDLDNNPGTTDDQLFVSASTSTMKGLFIDAPEGYDRPELSASVGISTVFNTPGDPTDIDGINGSLRFGFVEISTNNGELVTLERDGDMVDDGDPNNNNLSVSLGLQDQTTGATRFYLSDLFNGTSSDNFGNMVVGPTFGGSVLARLDQITVGGLGFNLPLGPNPEISAWIPDINHLNYNPDPYDAATNNQGIFLTYPTLGNLAEFHQPELHANHPCAERDCRST